MGRASIPVDLFNPGQVFACLGLMEAAEGLLGPGMAQFDWTAAGGVRFALELDGDVEPVAHVLEFLEQAEVFAVAPGSEAPDVGKWGLQLLTPWEETVYPQREPDSPATFPALLQREQDRIVIDSWGDTTVRDNVKFWAGAGGYPGAALVRDALELIRGRIDETVRADPFALAAPQTSSLRFDWRRDYVPLDAGFSLNEHGKIVPLGYPLVEVLAVIGLAHARPQRPNRRDKLSYRYAVLGGGPFPLALHRAALGCSSLPFPTRTFSMVLAWPGQENQARCITSVTEDPIS